jgi:lipoprotein signal peptidase
MLLEVKSRRVMLIAIAVAFAATDLVHKSLAPADFHHARTHYAAIVMVLLVAALVALVPRVSSRAASVGAGIACGGALGNLVSLLAWDRGVPDPLVLAGASYGLAFNLADVFAVCGDALLLSAVILHGLQHRGRLRERV